MLEIEIDGVMRDLRHLQKFIVTVKDKGKDGADLRVAVSLGRHTVSKSCLLGQHNMFDENGKPRKFCNDRYGFSLGLPALAEKIIINNYFSWESKDKNQSLNYAVVEMNPMRVRDLKDGEYQVVFYYLYPSDGTVADVNFVITSCHSRWVDFGRIKRRYNVHSLLRKCLFEGKRIP